MPLSPGKRFGSYEILELIGVGGMGEVYRARDTRLQRDVAIKVLSDARLLDADTVQRFEREALLLASLNHSNIATLHGLESSGDVQALVMELVEGEGLDTMIARKALPLRSALHIARQIADAIDAAHERGVVHRDLKPANVRVRADGAVKVLDFGIAKVLEPNAHGHGGATITARRVVVGTPSYMSPEQASGGTVDRRTDIWAFGCVLYEMLTGQRAFGGEGSSDILASVLEREPDWSKLPAGLPDGIRLLLQQCLEKDPRQRRRDAGDLRLELERALAASTQTAAHSVRRAPKRYLAILATAVLALAAVAFVALEAYSRRPADSRSVSFVLSAPNAGGYATPLFSGSGAPVGGSISPDGKMLAFTAFDKAGTITLWVRPLDSIEARELPGTADAALPFWSPDGDAIGFFSQGQLKKIAANGGATQTLSQVVRGQGGTWRRDGTIVYGGELGSALLRVSVTGGEPKAATTLAAGEVAHRFPQFLPDGDQFLYHVEASSAERSGVFVSALSDGRSRRLLAADSAALYAPPGRLLFVRRGTLFAQGFDAATRELVGDPVVVAQSVSSEGGAPAFSVSGTGVLTYHTGLDTDEQQFTWFDRAGKRLEAIGAPGPYRGVDLSPDGTRVAVHAHRGSGGDIWIFEPRGTTTRVTFDPSQDNASPIWSADGRHIAFGSLRAGRWGLYQTRADGEGEEQLLFESQTPKIPASWSPDGRFLVFWNFESDTAHQWVLPLTGDRTPTRLFNVPGYDGHSQISPDGRWIAYMASSSGRIEIYVRPFPSGEGIWQISKSGGLAPRWRHDGKEIYYMTSPELASVMAVPIDTVGNTLAPGEPRELFRVKMAIVPHSTAVPTFHAYAVSPDGERFVIPVPVGSVPGERAASAITVVLNWPALLAR